MNLSKNFKCYRLYFFRIFDTKIIPLNFLNIILIHFHEFKTVFRSFNV